MSSASKSRMFFSRDFLAFYVAPTLFLLVIGVLFLLTQWRLTYDGFREGEIAPRTYFAISSLVFEDTVATDYLLSTAANAVGGLVVRDLGAAERVRGYLTDFRMLLGGNEKRGAPTFPREMVAAFRALSADQREDLLDASERVSAAYFEIMSQTHSSRASGLPKIGGPKAGQRETREMTEEDRGVVWGEIHKLSLPPGDENFLYQLLILVMDPAYKIDIPETEKTRESVRYSMPTVERRLKAGDVIVERGQPVTSAVARILKYQGYTSSDFPWSQLAAASFLIITLPMWFDIMRGEVDVLRGYAGFAGVGWGCVVFVIVMGWASEAVASHMGVVGAGILPAVTTAYLCMPRRYAFLICIEVLISAIFIIIGMSVSNMLFLLVYGLMAATIGYYVLHRIQSRENLGYKVAALALLFTLFKIFAIYYQGFNISFAIGWPMGATWRRMGLFLAYGVVVTSLITVLLPMFENSIGVLSALRLRELSHPSSPLLRKMQAEVPGTYHHSLMIGTLAEAVSEELDIDQNLMKTGAYYHDIGKLRRPLFFIENQLGIGNVHDDMSPALSALAIIAHVREGLDLATEFGLPKKVRQFIAEHHGTTFLGYFYRKAANEGEKVDKEQFCYPGPKPQSRETALLMLLDSTEAAVRAGSGQGRIATVQNIQDVIEQVTALKISEHQLDDVDFTYREMTRIKKALLKALMSMYHTRVVKEIKEPRERNNISNHEK
ncbi:hypothetical protein AGMMS50276_17840 [Synergistales bacterium]|nr:hypothetical protein AGMMS50276_17840 [Synergistales bacterium]